MSTVSLRRIFPALTVVLALVLSACGGGTQPGGQSAAPQAGYPIRVQHKYGVTEIKAPAKRVVTLGLSDHEAVLALGVKPVGVVDWFKERPFGKWPWTQPLWGDTQPTIVGERDEYNFEAIAKLEPDLIIAQYSGMKKEQYDTLSQRWPVVAQPVGHDDYAAPWQEMTRMVGRALGKADRAEELIAGIDRRFADARAAHPQFAGKTMVVADSFKPGQYSVFAPHDPKMLFMTLLGFRVPDKIQALVGKSNVVDLGAERLDLLDVDRLVWLTSDKASEDRIKNEELYKRLNVARDKRDLFVSYVDPPIGGAISFNTVLSIPYAIDQMVPLLAAKK